MGKRKKIVAVGLYRPGTGFTRVFSSLFSVLKENCDIHWLGIAHRGDILDFGYKVYPSNLKGGDMYGAFEGRKIAEDVQADIVLLLNDFWMFKNYNVSFYRDPGPWKICAYIPLDGNITEYNDMGDLRVIDHIVVYTQFARQEILNAYKSVHQEPSISVIGHGTDTQTFYPLYKEGDHESILELKKNILGESASAKSSFIVLNANRHSERKNLGCTLNGFAHFVRDKPDHVYLCLHQPGIEAHQKKDLIKIITDLDIEDHVIINPFGDGHYVDDWQLNQLYNLSDVGVNTSLGEGWGMISFEHGACQKPQIVPVHSACKELWENHALLLDPVQSLYLNNNPFLMHRSKPEQLADHLNMLYHNKEVYNRMAKAAYDNARDLKYNWLSIAAQWTRLFESIV